MSDEREDAIEKALAALRRVPIPEGLEARVLDGIARRAGLARADAGMNAAWWRGALSGAAFAMLCAGLVMVAQHGLRGTAGSSRAAGRVAVASGSVEAVSGRPCASNSLVRARSVAQARSSSDRMRVASVAPIAAAPLTAEERELVRLARHGDVQELATVLNPEVRARMEAEDAASYQSFFAVPTPIAPDEPGSAEPAADAPAVEAPANEPPASEPISTEPAQSQPSAKTNTGENQ